MKKIDPRVIANQNRYNKAFDNWEKEGFIVGSENYNTIFNCILEAAKNKILAAVKFWDDEALGKATDLTLLVMERDEIGKHKKIESLGAFLDMPKLQFTINKQLQFNDKLGSYEQAVENGYDKGVEDTTPEKLYQVQEGERERIITADFLDDPTNLFEFLFNID